ncbi:MAG TPA: PEGA domain-containing protein, partial [Kofleriaceae bacterium]
RSAPMAATSPDSGQILIAPATPGQGASSGVVRQSSPMATVSGPVVAPVIVHASRLPWIVALVAVLVAGGVAVMFLMNKREVRPAAAVAAAPEAPVVMNSTPPPSRVAAPPPVDAAVAVAAPHEVVAVAPAPPPAPPKRHEPQREHEVVKPKEPVGPPGFITIDSTPVYAVIFIDGKKYGDTPLVNISVPPGRHAVKAVSSSGTTRTLSITIESGKTAPVRRIEW